MSSRNLIILALLAALALGAAAQSAPANGNGNKNKCAAEIEGCIKCRNDICTKCRAISTLDETTCKCNEDYGTISVSLFNKYRNDMCSGKRHCKRASYKSVEGKCVKCEKYGYISDVDTGQCVEGGSSPHIGRRLLVNAADDMWA